MTGRKGPRFLFAIVIAGLIAIGGSAAAAAPGYKRSVVRYAVPDVVLMNQDGARIRLRSLTESGKPVVLDFIYGTCTTICPVLSAGYTSLQGKLGPDTRKMQLISISIDPEHDTPKVMKGYLKQYRAKPGWDFLTGSRDDIDRVMRAFDSYVSDKMYHKQVTFIRAQGPGEWVRIDGLLGSSDLMNEIGKEGKK
jgi:protein SCO1/2